MSASNDDTNLATHCKSELFPHPDDRGEWLYTTGVIARATGLPENYLRAEIHAGELSAVRPNRVFKIKYQWYLDWLDKQRHPAAPQPAGVVSNG